MYLAKLKSFIDYKSNVAQVIGPVFGIVENNVGKGENADYQHFLLFPHCFQISMFPGSLKLVIVYSRLKFPDFDVVDLQCCTLPVIHFRSPCWIPLTSVVPEIPHGKVRLVTPGFAHSVGVSVREIAQTSNCHVHDKEKLESRFELQVGLFK